jgi:hypothetical protein
MGADVAILADHGTLQDDNKLPDSCAFSHLFRVYVGAGMDKDLRVSIHDQ